MWVQEEIIKVFKTPASLEAERENQEMWGFGEMEKELLLYKRL